MTTNIFDVVIGRETLIWDALWRTIAWLADPEEGHGEGATFHDNLAIFCFGKVVKLATEVEFLRTFSRD